MAAGRVSETPGIDPAVDHENAVGWDAVMDHDIFNFIGYCNVVVRQQAIFDTAQIQEAVAENGKVNPPGNQAYGSGADRSPVSQAVGMGRMGVHNTVFKFRDQSAHSKGGPRIDFTAQDHRKHRNPRFPGPLLHGGIGLAHQMAEDSAALQADQEIQCLLLTAPPGAFGVDMKSSKLSGHWLLVTGKSLPDRSWYKV
jgi:hypothetical protein